MQKPSPDQLNVLRWIVAAGLAVAYIFTGYETLLYLGVVVLFLPGLLRKKPYPKDEPKKPEEPR